MNIYLGNLSIEQIQKRAGVKFPEDLIVRMKETHQDSAQNVALGKWHCFDLPFVLVVGGSDFAHEIYGHLKDLGSQFKEPMQIALSASSS